MSEPRVIKKYPNRRLYDTVESRYITLTDVKRLVVDKIGFIVVDKKNNADITGSILLQVIGEQEHQSEPLLNQEFMTLLIRAYGASPHSLVAGHLEQSLRQYFSQHPLREKPKAIAGAEQARQRAGPEDSSKSVPR
ncbi:MAG: polyhydroxyalkanoate synthesis repressor PhaR [Steroidobacterales bacterium]